MNEYIFKMRIYLPKKISTNGDVKSFSYDVTNLIEYSFMARDHKEALEKIKDVALSRLKESGLLPIVNEEDVPISGVIEEFSDSNGEKLKIPQKVDYYCHRKD